MGMLKAIMQLQQMMKSNKKTETMSQVWAAQYKKARMEVKSKSESTKENTFSTPPRKPIPKSETPSGSLKDLIMDTPKKHWPKNLQTYSPVFSRSPFRRSPKGSPSRENYGLQGFKTSDAKFVTVK